MRPLALALALTVAATGASAQTTRFKDAQGRLTGRAEQRGDTTRFYDAQGRSTGRAEDRAGERRFYRPDGRLVGRAEPERRPPISRRSRSGRTER